MSHNDSSTIAALATAPAPAGVALIRVSGPSAKELLGKLFRSHKSPALFPRELVFGEVIDFSDAGVIDRALAVFMPGPASFTGEDVAEFHLHGSLLLVQRLLRSLFAAGATPAEPGEFTKRAFLNGKLDLSQAEAICDLISASSERALTIAEQQLKGALSNKLDKLSEPLRDVLAELEAGLDFPDEDINPQRLDQLTLSLTQALLTVEQIIGTSTFGQSLREGYRVLLCGPPNAGKSSLLNLLLEKERAIVTSISGTTRDLLEEEVSLGGYKFVFCDSAGIRETTDQVEKIGIELAESKIGWADLVLLMVDLDSSEAELTHALHRLKSKAKLVWLVVNKVDLRSENSETAFQAHLQAGSIFSKSFYISAKTGLGTDLLKAALISQLEQSLPNQSDSSTIVTNERHLSCLTRAKDSLTRALDGMRAGLSPELPSAEIRMALSALEELIGKTYTEDILSRIFSKFCIGK